MKKILSLVLVIALVLGSFSFAFAATPADVVDTDYEEAVEVLMALGVVNGYPDGTYKPERVVTRAEMAKLLVEALGYGQLAGGTAPYSDTAGHWAAGSIGLASGIGLVQGYPDGTFKPDATVSFDEAVTMILRALGYTDESLRGAWPTNYKIKAIDLGLYDDTSAQTGGADRGNVAIMLFNALGLQIVEIKDGVATPVVTGALLLIDKVGKKVPEVNISYTDIYDEDDALDTAIDLTPYLYHTITYYENKDGEVAYVSKVHTSEYVGTVVDPSAAGKLKVEDANDKTKEFSVTSATALFLNGDEADTTTAAGLSTEGNAHVRVIYKDSTVYGVVAEQFEIVVLTTEYSARRPVFLNGSGTGRIALPAEEDDDDNVVLDAAALTIVGDATSLTTIEEDDLVYVYASETESLTGHPAVLKLLVVRDTVTGRFTERNSATKGVFGGTTYSVSDFSDVELTSGMLGNTYTLTLDKDGKIFSLETEDEATTEAYAVFVATAAGTISEDDFTLDLSVDKAPRLRVFTEGGNVVIYNLYTDGLDVEVDGDTDTLGDIELQVSGSSILVNTSLTKKDLVEIEMNDDGEVVSVSLIDNYYDDNDFVKADMLLSSYDVTSNTKIFDVTETDEDDWKVISASTLVNGIEGYYAVSSSTFNVLVMSVTDGFVTSDTYAAVVSVTDYYDGSDTVRRVTAFVDGVSGTYISKKGFNANFDGIADEIVVFTFDGERLTDAEVVTGDALVVKTIDTIRIREDNTAGTIYTLASDVVVYIMDDGDFSVGAISDVLAGDTVSVFYDNDGDVTVILLDLDNQPL